MIPEEVSGETPEVGIESETVETRPEKAENCHFFGKKHRHSFS